MITIHYIYMKQFKELKQLVKSSWMSVDEILDQVRDWYSRWHEFAKNIREEFKEEDRLFTNQKKNKDKLWDTTFFTMHSAMMARDYVDRPTSKFLATSNGQLQIVKNLNAALDADYGTAEYEAVKFQQSSDKYRYWPWIALRKGWDGNTKKPEYNNIDPRLIIFDPDWDYFIWDYVYFGYERLDYQANLTKENGYYNIEDLPVNNWDTNWPKNIKQSDQNNASLIEETWNSLENPSYNLYYHFDTFGWQRAVVVTDNNHQSTIIKVILLKSDWEVKAFEDILSVKYWRYERNNPYGMRISKLGIADLQKLKAKLINLFVTMMEAGLYPMYTYNTRLIKNKADLDFGLNKLVPTTPLEWENLQNAVQPLNRDLKWASVYPQLEWLVNSQAEQITAVNKLAQWSSPERREAATTNKILQDNTDINLAFNAKIDAVWEEKFIRTWLAWYLEKFTDWDKKLIYIQTWFGLLPRELKKKEFISDLAVKIKIETQIEIDEKKQKDRIAYGQLIGYLQTVPNRPIASQLNTLRNFARAMNMSEEDIEIELPATAQEIIAQENVWLLLDWEIVEVQASYDPDTHLIAIKAAGYWDNIDAYKYGLLKLKKIQWEKQEEVVNEWMANNLAAQATTNTMNEATSLQQ